MATAFSVRLAHMSRTILLDLSRVTSLEDFHRAVDVHLFKPMAYGANLDAFWDCVSDLRDLTVQVIPPTAALPEVRAEINRYLDLMREHAGDPHSRFTVVGAWRPMRTHASPSDDGMDAYLGTVDPFDDAVLAEMSRACGVVFPDEFLRQVRRHGGMIAAGRRDFDFTDADDGRVFHAALARIFSFDRTSPASILTAWTRYAPRLPVGFVPLAECAGSDLACGRIIGREIGPIHYWRHGLEGMGTELSFVADCFSDFMALLTEPTDDEEER